jgi:2-(1,2-epoxy-1,2-dihydrophenyl)acetyl-CoA isomerase
LVPLADLHRAAREWARELASGLPAAVALSKAILNRTFELSPRDVFAPSAEAIALCYITDEHQESVADFLSSSKSRRG